MKSTWPEVDLAWYYPSDPDVRWIAYAGYDGQRPVMLSACDTFEQAEEDTAWYRQYAQTPAPIVGIRAVKSLPRHRFDR